MDSNDNCSCGQNGQDTQEALFNADDLFAGGVYLEDEQEGIVERALDVALVEALNVATELCLHPDPETRALAAETVLNYDLAVREYDALTNVD